MRKKINSPVLLFFLPALFFMSCNETPTPKPRAYFRVEFPEKGYQQYDNPECPYRFNYPVYSKIERKETQFGDKVGDPCWINVIFEDMNGTLYLSYKSLEDSHSLGNLLEDTHFMTYKHTIKADYINEYGISDPDSSKYGLYYAVGGNAASSIQFYLTDSTKNFLRGSVYFRSQPNWDSIQPILKFIEKDVKHFIETFEWTDGNKQLSMIQ